MRKCKTCGSLKDESEFRRYFERNGKIYKSWECKSCNYINNKVQNDKHREERNIRKTEKLRKLKKDMLDYRGGKCSMCGYDKCIGSLDFHHIDPSKKETIINKFRNLETAKPELDKCIILCANCHRELHFNEGKVFSKEAREKNAKSQTGRYHTKEQIQKITDSVLKFHVNKRKLESELVTI